MLCVKTLKQTKAQCVQGRVQALNSDRLLVLVWKTQPYLTYKLGGTFIFSALLRYN